MINNRSILAMDLIVSPFLRSNNTLTSRPQGGVLHKQTTDATEETAAASIPFRTKAGISNEILDISAVKSPTLFSERTNSSWRSVK